MVARLREARRAATVGPPVAPLSGMSKPPIPISEFMTRNPICMRRVDTLAKARGEMRDRDIRHVVVLDEDRLDGIVSERDLIQFEKFADVDANVTQLHEAMMPAVYAASIDTPLAEVAAAMADGHYGCAVVRDGKRVVGIFTTTDALRALARVTGPQ
jgi:acetoin utilization protein AcuB